MKAIKLKSEVGFSKTDGTFLPVMERFYTIQGEGQFSGNAAYFIRLAGCDVGCSWCDVKESWTISDEQWFSVESIIDELTSCKADIVVITGGEPAMYDLTALTKAIHKIGKRTHIETSGAYEIMGDWDWITLSPKKFKNPLLSSLKIANELKVVVLNNHDFFWAKDNAQYVSDTCKLLLQPEWEKRALIMPKIVDFVKDNPTWQASLQTHKYLNVP